MQVREFKDSGGIELKNTATITTGSTYVFNLSKKYEPYNILSLANLDGNYDIEVWINQTHKVILPAGNQRTFHGYNIRDLRIKNIGTGTIIASNVRGIIRNDGYIGKEIISAGGSIFNTGMALVRTIKLFKL